MVGSIPGGWDQWGPSHPDRIRRFAPMPLLYALLALLLCCPDCVFFVPQVAAVAPLACPLSPRFQ